MSKQYENDNPQMAKIVERNIHALIKRKKEEENKRTVHEKVIDGITGLLGSMNFVYFHVFLFGSWILLNSGLLDIEPFDKSFIMLATFAAVEAIFLSTFVLISQNRTNILADKRAELDLQIGLLTEHEVTRVMTIVTAIAKKMDIKEANDLKIEELSKDIHPEKVLDTLENASDNRISDEEQNDTC